MFLNWLSPYLFSVWSNEGFHQFTPIFIVLHFVRNLTGDDVCFIRHTIEVRFPNCINKFLLLNFVSIFDDLLRETFSLMVHKLHITKQAEVGLKVTN